MTKISLKSGYIVLPSYGASGGIHYVSLGETTTVNDDGSEVTVYKKKKVVDNKEMCKRVDAVRHKVEYALKKHASKTAFGYFADEEQLKALTTEIETIKEKASEVNRLSAAAGCGRRVHVAIIPNKIDLASPDAAQEVAYTVRDVLSEGRHLLREGMIDKLEPLLVRNKNLAQLGVGITATLIEDALGELKAARKRIRERVKRGMTPESAAKQEEFDCVRSAVDFFSPLEETEHDADND